MVSYLKVFVLIRTGYCSLDHGLFNAIQNGGLVHNIDLKAKKYSSHVRGKVLVYAIGSGLCYSGRCYLLLANESLCKVWFTQMCVYRFYIPLLILLANDVKINLGSFYHVDLSKTVTADYHQGDVSLFGMRVGKQCAAVCFTARTIYPECL